MNFNCPSCCTFRTATPHQRILFALATAASYLLALVIGAYFSGSLAMLADASHMVAHNLALIVALAASFLSQKFQQRKSRIEAIGGLINSAIILLMAFNILNGATHHHHHAHGDHTGAIMLGVATFGFIMHGLTVLVLHGGRKHSINLLGLYLHLLLDMLSTITVFATGVIIHLTNNHSLDKWAALFIAALIIISGSKLLFNSARQLIFNKAPKGHDHHIHCHH